MKSMFKKIDNGYKVKLSYQCIVNGLIIEPGDGCIDLYKYYVGEHGFDYLADAKKLLLKSKITLDIHPPMC